ncbi:hypothetical protein OE749_08390 [Aestuariibacter sp. AA17]|uniref:Uncharacterized protein n=1 Tax=Fluctibacter corallii TaxID=2984329 RepID=A0ABT3A7R0_9ALTE|nr:hypothetical protein [Aestuariibacter sp. AA17]MCV2884712.1 hypothetical protein [Aestuariibacter sp. AA17]
MKENLLNQSVLLTQALLGVISPNFRMVSIRLEKEMWIVTIVLEEEDAQDLEEIEDLEVEYEVLQRIY